MTRTKAHYFTIDSLTGIEGDGTIREEVVLPSRIDRRRYTGLVHRCSDLKRAIDSKEQQRQHDTFVLQQVIRFAMEVIENQSEKIDLLEHRAEQASGSPEGPLSRRYRATANGTEPSKDGI